MKRYLFGLLALLLIAGGVEAGMNKRQNRDGTADWVNSHNNASALGAVYLTTLIADVSTASTSVVVSPITDAIIDDVQLVMYGTVSSANAEILITVGNAVSDGGVAHGATRPRRVSVVSPLTNSILLPATFIIPSTAATGNVFSVSPIFMLETTGFSNRGVGTAGTNATRLYIEKGTVIYIATDGGSTGTTSALVVITLRPRG